MQAFEAHALHHWFDIYTLLSSDACNYSKGFIPSPIRNKWSKQCCSLYKSSKINSLQTILTHHKSIQTNLFNSCIEYNKSSSFIQNNLIPMIINYETDDSNIKLEIQHTMINKIKNHSLQTKHSIFNILGWIELILFCSCIVFQLLSLSSLTLHSSIILLIIYLFHLSYAIYIFQTRRIICYYLNCLSQHSNINNRCLIYTAYILEGFNICNPISLSNKKFVPFKLHSSNKIDSSIAAALALKYIFGIIYCICHINTAIAFIIMTQLPFIYAIGVNFDNIFAHFNKNNYKRIMKKCAPFKNKCLQKYKIESKCACDYINEFCLYSIQCIFCSLLSALLVLFLASFPFGLSIMCGVQFELDCNYWLYVLIKDWSLIMSIKLSIAPPIIFIINCFQREFDVEQMLFFMLMGCFSNNVLLYLWNGMDSCIIIVFIIISWIILYLYLMMYSLKKITTDLVGFIEWKCLFKLKWFCSNLLQTKCNYYLLLLYKKLKKQKIS